MRYSRQLYVLHWNYTDRFITTYSALKSFLLNHAVNKFSHFVTAFCIYKASAVGYLTAYLISLLSLTQVGTITRCSHMQDRYRPFAHYIQSECLNALWAVNGSEMISCSGNLLCHSHLSLVWRNMISCSGNLLMSLPIVFSMEEYDLV